MSNETRIKLAEARGWRRVAEGENAWWPAPYVVEEIKRKYPDALAIDYVGIDSLPDPENDANDDYAVLKWARENLTPRQFVKFSENIANLLIGLEKKKPFDALCISLTTEYQIGFYAKAALPLTVPVTGQDDG